MKTPASDVALLAIWDLVDRQGTSEAKRRAIAQAALDAAKQKATELTKEKPRHAHAT